MSPGGIFEMSTETTTIEHIKNIGNKLYRIELSYLLS